MATKNKGKKVGGAKTKKSVIKPGEPVVVDVTKEVFFLNTVFFEANGVAIGDKVELSEESIASLKWPEGHEFATPKEAVKTVKNVGAVAPKVTCPIAILKGNEFIRVYPKGQEAEASEFLGKNLNMRGLSPKDLVSITVQWRENEKKKDTDTGRIVDTGRLITKTHVFSEKNNGEDWFKQARRLASEGPRRSCVASVKGEKSE